MNYRNCGFLSVGGALRRRTAPWQRLLALAPLALPAPAFAELDLTTAATIHYEYNSNVYQIESSADLPPGTKGGSLGDGYLAEAGELDLAYLLGQQQFYASISGDDVHYNRFTELNHADYTLDGGWVWKAGDLWDGILDVTRIRTMVSFYNLIGSQLVLQTEQRETGKVGFQFVPDWRTELNGMTRTVDQPQQNDPNLSLRESSGQLALKYTGFAGLTSGVLASYLSGSFSGTEGFVVPGEPPGVTPTYTQRSEGLTVTDDISGLSKLRGEIGYTSRSSSTGIDRISGVTGDLDYTRNLTGKTSAELEFSRQITVYLTNTGSDIDNVAALRLNWQATYKTQFSLVYNYIYRQLPGQGNVPQGSDRIDRLNVAQFTVKYQPFDWLLLSPYYQYQGRKATNVVDGNFSANSFGLNFTVQWEKGKLPQRPLMND